MNTHGIAAHNINTIKLERLKYKLLHSGLVAIKKFRGYLSRSKIYSSRGDEVNVGRNFLFFFFSRECALKKPVIYSLAHSKEMWQRFEFKAENHVLFVLPRDQGLKMTEFPTAFQLLGTPHSPGNDPSSFPRSRYC